MPSRSAVATVWNMALIAARGIGKSYG